MCDLSSNARQALAAASLFVMVAVGEASAGPTEDALAYGEKALKIGEASSAVTTWMNAYNERASEKTEKDETCAKLLSNLADVYGQLSQFDVAQQCLERLVGIRRELNGKAHPETAKAEARLVTVVASIGKDLDLALKVAKESLDALPADDEALAPSRMVALVNYSSVLLRRKERIEANEACLAALEFAKKYPKSKPELLPQCYENMAAIAGFFGRAKDRMNYLETALAKQREVSGKTSTAALNSWLNIADARRDGGETEKARAEYEGLIQAIKGGKEGKDDANVTFLLTQAEYRLAIMEFSANNLKRSLELLKAAAASGEKALGKDANGLLSVYLDLARVALREEDYDTGVATYRKVVSLRKKHLGADHKDTQETQRILDELEADVRRVRGRK